MRIQPLSPAGLVEELAELIASRPADRWQRVAIDGPPAAAPETLAGALVDPLRVRGRAVLRVSTMDFLRPASVRLEYGRTNPDAYYESWLDESALRREVLDRLAPGGSGRILPALWDTGSDRATRSGYLTAPPGAVLLVSGAFLLGAGLPFELTVHLALSAAALHRRTPPGQAWTLPAFARYAGEVAPAGFADVVVRLDDPAHPAVAFRAGGPSRTG
ncbi:MAG TPA: uridine kinase [Micromonosporaceae bacterium]|nr:uridine kinase [Micromonosporaceae bacterium]